MVNTNFNEVKEEKTVNIINILMNYKREAEAEFFVNIKESDIMEMSFTHDELITVKVLGETNESSPGDIKYDVEIIAVENNTSVGKGKFPDSHKVGEKRWVRIYDLKKLGYYNAKWSN